MDEREEILDNDIRFTTIGRVDELAQETLDELRERERLSADCEGMVLRLALNYGGSREITGPTRPDRRGGWLVVKPR